MIPYNIFQTAYMAPDIEAVVALATRRLGSPRMHGRADVQLTISAFSLDLAAPGIGFESFPGLQIFGYPLRPTCTCRIDIVKANPAAPPRIRPNYPTDLALACDTASIKRYVLNRRTFGIVDKAHPKITWLVDRQVANGVAMPVKCASKARIIKKRLKIDTATVDVGG